MGQKQVRQENIIDQVQKLHSTATRTGVVASRAAKLTKAGVHPQVTALQMTLNSPNGHTYTPDFVTQLAALHQDCASRVPLTDAMTKGLLADQATIDTTYLAPQPI